MKSSFDFQGCFSRNWSCLHWIKSNSWPFMCWILDEFSCLFLCFFLVCFCIRMQFPFTAHNYVKLSVLTIYSFKIHNTDRVSWATQLHSIFIRSLLPADLPHRGIGMWHVYCQAAEIKSHSETAFADSFIFISNPHCWNAPFNVKL